MQGRSGGPARPSREGAPPFGPTDFFCSRASVPGRRPAFCIPSPPCTEESLFLWHLLRPPGRPLWFPSIIKA